MFGRRTVRHAATSPKPPKAPNGLGVSLTSRSGLAGDEKRSSNSSIIIESSVRTTFRSHRNPYSTLLNLENYPSSHHALYPSIRVPQFNIHPMPIYPRTCSICHYSFKDPPVAQHIPARLDGCLRTLRYGCILHSPKSTSQKRTNIPYVETSYFHSCA